MLRKLKVKKGIQGFTLIELMIVIAIIGILAAIAIPNFIAYRNKAFCSQAESDANNIMSAVSDYFAIPSHTLTPTMGDIETVAGNLTTEGNQATIIGLDPSVSITVIVTDGSGRCPTDYQGASTWWDGGYHFTKEMLL